MSGIQHIIRTTSVLVAICDNLRWVLHRRHKNEGCKNEIKTEEKEKQHLWYKSGRDSAKQLLPLVTNILCSSKRVLSGFVLSKNKFVVKLYDRCLELNIFFYQVGEKAVFLWILYYESNVACKIFDYLFLEGLQFANKKYDNKANST